MGIESIFLTILNRGLSAVWLIAAVLVLRIILQRAPRRIHCLLWALVAVRLLCPFSFTSLLSLVPSGEPVSETSAASPVRRVNTGLEAVDVPVNRYLEDRYWEKVGEEYFESGRDAAVFAEDTPHTFTAQSVLAIVWLGGVIVLLLYGGVSYVRLRRRVHPSLPLLNNIWQCDHIATPFILGVFRPRIYLPSQMDEAQAEYVIAHEKAHILRRDHWWKPLGFLILAVYWWQPLCWVSYLLLCRDIELACDEQAVADYGLSAKKAYAQALLACSAKANPLAVCPLAFGEVSVKERVKKILSYRKPAFYVVMLSLLACLAVAVCFLADPIAENAKNFGVFVAAKDCTGFGVALPSEVAAGRVRTSLDDADSAYTEEAVKRAVIQDQMGVFYTLPEGLYEYNYSVTDTGYGYGVLLEPAAYETVKRGAAPDAWTAAGLISNFPIAERIEWDGDKIGEFYKMDNHSSWENYGAVDGLCAPAYLFWGEHDLYTAAEPGRLEEQGTDTAAIETTTEYWYLCFARPSDERGYLLALNARNYTKEDILAFGAGIEYLKKPPVSFVGLSCEERTGFTCLQVEVASAEEPAPDQYAPAGFEALRTDVEPIEGGCRISWYGFLENRDLRGDIFWKDEDGRRHIMQGAMPMTDTEIRCAEAECNGVTIPVWISEFGMWIAPKEDWRTDGQTYQVTVTAKGKKEYVVTQLPAGGKEGIKAGLPVLGGGIAGYRTGSHDGCRIIFKEHITPKDILSVRIEPIST